MQLAGHGKDPRLVQVELPLVPNVGDRIREDMNSENWVHKLDHLIREGEFVEAVERYQKIFWQVRLKNGKSVLFNSEDCKIIDRAPVLVEKEINQSLPEQGNFAVSISGEAIFYDPNAKPVEFKPSGAIDESYIDSFKIGDRIKFREGYRTNLDYERKTGIITAIDNLNIEVMWDGENDSDRYTKFHIGYNQWWEKLDPLPSIDADDLPNFDHVIATEPTKSVANLRMDERSFSVLVEKVDQSVLVESGDQSVLVESDRKAKGKKRSSSGYVYPDKPSVSKQWFEEQVQKINDSRYQFLLERREQLIASGACPDGIWINCGKVPHRDFKQAVWKSDKPQPQWGNKKSQYIGKFGGEEHLSAIAQHKAGQELRKIEREIRKLQVKS